LKQRHDGPKENLKAVVLDLDGTLFHKDQTISQRTIHVLNQWRNMGKEVIIATGRPPRFVFGILPGQLQYRYCICYNGAEIYRNRQLICQNLIPGESVQNILEWLRLTYPGCIISVEAGNQLFTNYSLDKFEPNLDYRIVDFKSMSFENAAKILVDLSSIPDISIIERNLPGNCRMLVTGKSLGEIFLRNISKLTGVQFILNSIGLELKETIAIGDDNNDIELISECGVGVAMGNATAAVKQVADLVTGTNQEDGVAVILEKIIADGLNKDFLTDTEAEPIPKQFKINTSNEGTLHANIKEWYSLPGDRFEEKVDGYIIDLIREGEQRLLIEVQTGHFEAIGRKLKTLIQNHKVRLIFPIAREKWILKINTSGEIISRRRSPKTGKPVELFKELLRIPEIIRHENFSLEILMVKMEEIRCADGRGSWRRGGVSIKDRRLIEVFDKLLFVTRSDFLKFIPEGLQRPFTNKTLAKNLGQSIYTARKVTYCLKKMDVIKETGKNRNELLFEVVEIAGADL
jgi:Cof subfamily protein (haloacid dehalogenase superfamily)